VSFSDNPSGESGWLDANPHEGVSRKPLVWDSDMQLEDVGSPLWGTRCTNCWPPFVSLHPSLWSFWMALTHLAGFTFEPGVVSSPPPPAIEGPIGDMTFVSLVGAAGAMCE
jgi:hypothetical protein